MTIIGNVKLIEHCNITPADIVIEDGRISRIAAPGSVKKQKGCEYIEGNGLYLSHGFLDIHVHGGGGADFMDGSKESWHQIARLHLSHGTTAMVPTTLAADSESLLKAFDTFKECQEGFADGAKFLGVHVEGPYLSPAQCGAQDPAYIRHPDPEEYKKLIRACPKILRWTIAPELPGALEMGDYLVSQGILPCIGHSDATCDQVRMALFHGFRHVTHLYSATSTIVRKQGFRHAGIVESAYLLDTLTSEIIADGCHLPPDLLKMAYRFIGPNRLCLVTDAMRAAGQEGGESILGSLETGQPVIIEDGVAKMPDRLAFAGSICTTDRLVRTMARHSGASLAEAVHMMTAVPAHILGLSGETGSVLPGRKADLVMFDENITIRMVMTDGIVRLPFTGAAIQL